MSAPAEATFPQSDAIFPQPEVAGVAARAVGDAPGAAEQMPWISSWVKSAASSWMHSLRPLKLGLGLTALFAGVYAVMADQHYVTSNTAVVSGYVTSIRVPIDGTLDLSRLRTGTEVRQGQLLASVDNALFDQHHLYDLAEQRNVAATAARAAAEQSTTK